MKTLYFKIMALVALVAMTACTEDNISDLRLGGDCSVEALSIDGYEGIIDHKNHTVTVRVPEVYDVTDMTVSSLRISNGAESNLKEGEAVNLSAPKVIHVTNGDVYLDWTVTVKHDEANITSFIINGTYTGIIDDEAKTVSVFVPEALDVSSLTPTIVISDDATILPLSGVPADFTNPVKYTVKNNTATTVYTVTVKPIGKPKVVYAGLANSMDGLNIEEQTACRWMLANVQNSLYVSFDDIKKGTVDLSECKVIWWHFHKDGGIDGKAAFENTAPEAISAVVKLIEYYNNGGAFLLTRYATNLPAYLGAVADDGVPNNCWGQNEDDAETVSSPWSFYITGHTGHALYQNLIAGSDPDQVYTCDAGYLITNSTAQWHIGSDWGGYNNTEIWRLKTGGVDLGYGGDGAIVTWEFPADETHGGILCIGSGCYDWYSISDVEEKYHKNVATMTLNAFKYLMNE